MRISFALFFVLILNSLTLRAEPPVNPGLSSDSISPSYIESYDTTLGVYGYGILKYNNFSFQDKDEKNIQYKPNENLNLGLGFNYRWLGLGIAFNSGVVNNDDHIYGNTRSMDLQLDLYPKGWMINTYVQFYKGFYWNNPTDYFPEWDTRDSLLIRGDIRTRTFGTSAVYAFNQTRFSYKAPFVFTEIQRKSAGSLLAGFSFSTYHIRGDSSLIPHMLIDDHPDAYGINRINASLIGALGGYSYTYVFYENFFANLTLLLGLNYQKANAHNPDLAYKMVTNSLAFNGIARFAIGYNQPRYYLGFTGYLQSFTVRNLNSTDLLYGLGKFRFVLGFRLKAMQLNKKLDHAIDYINDKNPMYKQ